MSEALTRYRLRQKHQAELDTLDDAARAARVAELNVHQSIDVLRQHSAIKKAVVERALMIHGLIYDLATGQLKVLEQTNGKPNASNDIVNIVETVKEAQDPQTKA